MKKLFVIGLIILMTLSSSVMVFAEETGSEDRPVREKTEVSREEREARVIALFEEYNPGALDDFLSVKASHEAFHETAKAEKTAVREELKTEKEAIKAAVENGEMTREEAREIFESFKANMETVKAELEIVKENKKAEVVANREETKAVFMAIKEALSAEDVDSAYVAGLLESIIPLLHEHVNIDYFYHEQVMTLINSL